MDKNEASSFGKLISLNVLVAQTLAIATRNHNDPRGALRDTLSAIEEELATSLSELRGSMPDDVLETLFDSAQTNVLTVAGMADSFLKHMGAPPAA